MRHITVAIDSFKGSLTSHQAANAVEAGIRVVEPHCTIRKVIIADGGEGTVAALVENSDGRMVQVVASDPLMRPIVANYGIIDNSVAVVDIAQASGLTLLEPHLRNSLKSSSYGTGEIIVSALTAGYRRFILGLGGSATNDGGVGMLRALGFRFLDNAGRELIGGGEILESIATIDSSKLIPAAMEAEFTIACDVNNPLYGINGAAHIFAPQKGADIAAVERLDRGLRNFAKAIKDYNGADIANIPGAGAAGGLGGGAMALLGAKIESGIDVVLRAAHFDEIIANTDLVITGEGKIDAQTLMGKAPVGVLQAAQRHNVPTLALCGRVELCDELKECGFEAILPLFDNSIADTIAMQQHHAETRITEVIAQYLNKSRHNAL